jgi:hypothetical protein
LHNAGDDLDQGRFAGTVLAEHGMDLAALASKIDILKRSHAAIAFRDAREGEKILPCRCIHGAAPVDHGNCMNPGGGTARHEAGQSGGMVYRFLRRTILAEKRKPLFEDGAFRDHFTLASL